MYNMRARHLQRPRRHRLQRLSRRLDCQRLQPHNLPWLPCRVVPGLQVGKKDTAQRRKTPEHVSQAVTLNITPSIITIRLHCLDLRTHRVRKGKPAAVHALPTGTSQQRRSESAKAVQWGTTRWRRRPSVPHAKVCRWRLNHRWSSASTAQVTQPDPNRIFAGF